jgi:hypothetical protein
MEVMEIEVKEIKESDKIRDQEFITELANGYLNVEITEKEELMKEFSKAYEDIEDKDSFNGQYLEILIDVLEDEIKEKKNFLFF